jgi:hypothetical protein
MNLDVRLIADGMAPMNRVVEEPAQETTRLVVIPLADGLASSAG